MRAVLGALRQRGYVRVCADPSNPPYASNDTATPGFEVELVFPHWLGKARAGDDVIDVIFSSGNGVATVDDLWLAHGVEADVLGVPTRLCPPEEMIWSKAFIMERERYDGADVAHLLRAGATWQKEVRWDGVGYRAQALDLLRENKVQVLLGQKYFGWGSESVRLLRGIKNSNRPSSPIIDSGVAPSPDLDGSIQAFYDFTGGKQLAALRNERGQDAVSPHGGEQQCKAGKEPKELCQETRSLDGCSKDPLHIAKANDWYSRVHFTDHALNGLRQCCWSKGTAQHHMVEWREPQAGNGHRDLRN